MGFKKGREHPRQNGCTMGAAKEQKASVGKGQRGTPARSQRWADLVTDDCFTLHWSETGIFLL